MTKENKFDQLIHNLNRQEPAFNDAKSVTESIMQKIEKQRHSTPVFLYFTRIISNVAAALLIGFFLYQYKNTEKNDIRYYTYAIENTEIDSKCIQEIKKSNLSLTEGYHCYLKENSLKNKELKSYYQKLKN